MAIFNFHILFLFLYITFIAIINSHTLFPGPKSTQEKMCLNRTNPSKEVCTAIEAANEQDACCFVSYKNEETGEKFSHCGYLENTEYGIKIYKHIYSEYKEIQIDCKTNYIRKFILLYFCIIFLLI